MHATHVTYHTSANASHFHVKWKCEPYRGSHKKDAHVSLQTYSQSTAAVCSCQHKTHWFLSQLCYLVCMSARMHVRPSCVTPNIAHTFIVTWSHAYILPHGMNLCTYVVFKEMRKLKSQLRHVRCWCRWGSHNLFAGMNREPEILVTQCCQLNLPLTMKASCIC